MKKKGQMQMLSCLPDALASELLNVAAIKWIDGGSE